jgi:hypothetical protein
MFRSGVTRALDGEQNSRSVIPVGQDIRLCNRALIVEEHKPKWRPQDCGDVCDVGPSTLRLELSYRIRTKWEDEWQNIQEPVPILWKPCRFGGRRPFFLCPGVVNGVHCGRQVVNLYCAGKYFLCRHCYRLTYTSRQERAYDRVLRRVDKLRMSLGSDPGIASDFPEKPKGMHWRTYRSRLMLGICDRRRGCAAHLNRSAARNERAAAPSSPSILGWLIVLRSNPST